MNDNIILFPVNLALFSGNGDVPINNTYTNRTTDAALSDAMKTYYSDYLIDLAEPLLVHDQFGQTHDIPKGKGKTIEFRKYDPLPKMLTPLVEGVTPDGQKLSLGVLTATVQQYGGYVELSDILQLTAIDDQVIQATKLLASQAGRTLDTITREVLAGGTNVQYAEGQVNARGSLVGGSATASANHYLTVDAVRMAVRTLKRMNAPKINGWYVGIIHPDVAYDLMSDPDWKAPHQYVDTENIYNGEIGRIGGVRFVETTEAKTWSTEKLTAASTNLSVKTAISAATKTVTVNEAITNDDAGALAGRVVAIGGSNYTIEYATPGTATNASINLTTTISSASANATISPAGAGASGRTVYSTLIMGDDAYGVTKLSGGGLEHIVKQLGSGGSTDPLDQRSTVGWKATKVAERLVEPYMVRIETTSSYA